MRRLNTYTQTSAMLMDVLAKGMDGKVYNLAAGDPDLELCRGINKAYYGLDINTAHRYGSSGGMEALRKKLWEDPDRVLIANGAKQLIYMALMTVTRPGDQVILVGPCWGSYVQICRILGLRYRLICGPAEERFIPDIEKIEACAGPETAGILINNPNNPTGVIYDTEYLKDLERIAEETDCTLICDEIYKDLGCRTVPSLKGHDRVIVIDGFSKSFNMTGWRLGYAVASPEIIRSMADLQSQMSGPPSTLIQTILLNAWDDLKTSCYEDYRDRLDVLCTIPKFAAFRPEAGFYFYLPIDGKWESPDQLCRRMLTEHRIALTRGEDYGVSGTVRLSVAAEKASELEKIIDCLREI